MFVAVACRAELPDGTIVAIKRLAAGSTQGDEEFKAEVQCLGSLKHKNIVGLVAAFVATRPSTERLLVYEFLSGAVPATPPPPPALANPTLSAARGTPSPSEALLTYECPPMAVQGASDLLLPTLVRNRGTPQVPGTSSLVLLQTPPCCVGKQLRALAPCPRQEGRGDQWAEQERGAWTVPWKNRMHQIIPSFLMLLRTGTALKSMIDLIVAGLVKSTVIVWGPVAGGSLDQCIVEDMPEDSPYRKFKVRRSIVTDVARGLKYLHHDVEPAIIHRDMKPANVLMDENLVAMVADFGLAKTAAFEEGKAHMTVEEIFGTAGYVAPEYNSLGRVSCKSDVYAYGVTLIQIISGRRTTDSDIVEQGLQRWANSAGAKIVDPNLDLKDDNELALAMGAVKIGVLCTARVPVDRPSMLEVVRMLENLEEFVGQSPSSDTQSP